MARLSTIVLILATATASARGDFVQAAGERSTGDIAFAGGKITIAQKTIEWKDVVLLAVQSKKSVFAPTQFVQFAGGDVLACQILSQASNKVAVHSFLVGRLELDALSLSQLQFLPKVAVSAVDKGVLYREEGEPIPGQLAWLDGRQLAIDSPLGMLTLKRDGVARYVYDPAALRAATRPATQTATGNSAQSTQSSQSVTGPIETPSASSAPPALSFAGTFEVVLLDGSRLTGQLAPLPDKLVLRHAVLKDVAIPLTAVRAAMRRDAAVTQLADLKPQIDAKPLLVKAVQPETVEFLEGSGKQTGMLAALRGMKIWPEATVSYRLPKGASRKFIATLQSIEGSAGDVHVRVRSGQSTLFDQDVPAGGDVVPLNLALTDSDDLFIDVTFAAKVKFPCGVLLADPMVFQAQ
ncbi:MAG: hypothetical protein ACE15C_04000 [Phycisphaerae bacterium]